MAYNPGDMIYFKHPKESWMVGNIVSGSSGKEGWTCKSNDELRKCVGVQIDKLKDEDVTNCREDLLDEGPHDLLSLTVLHDATLLRCLYKRYMEDIIYTNIGAIVVALNPFNFKIPWYLDDKMEGYLAEGTVIEKNLPHSWAQAHNTYNEMIADSGNQCILISGESGAGKTEATKIVMKYLARISSLRGTEQEKTAGMAVGTKLNSCSPMLESFGNAKTVRNDNSSRFGKFMKVKFNQEGQLVGAHTTKYLLEKSRIVTASQNERVYHAFYMVVRGKYAAPCQMDADKAYRSLNAGECLHNAEFDSASDFDAVCNSMLGIGMKQEEIDSVWICTAGILAFLNVQFVAEGEGSKIAGATGKYLDNTVARWKVDKEALAKELCTTTLQMRDGPTEKLLRPANAVDVRDALAKAMYDNTFGWLVDKANELCDVEQSGNWIGLLDIFGFEDFKYNSFEQLCINLTNETLQNHYNTYIFDKDMEECRKEGIDVTEVKCPDNAPCLKLIASKGGILTLLDDECSLGKGTDIAFLDSVVKQHASHAFFGHIKTSKEKFQIHHYAASVVYTVTGWLEKNRDTLKDAMKLTIRASADPLIAGLLPEPVPQDQKKGKALTVGGFFKDQVFQLMDVINSTNPHWIRCVKPHPAKKPKMFDGAQSMNQLESSGVLGTVKIRKAGYPIRTGFDKFNIRYKIILTGADSSKTGRDMSEAVLRQANMNDKAFAQLGTTKVFMKSEAFPMIEKLRNQFLLNHARRLQSVGSGYLERLKVNKQHCMVQQKKFSDLLIEEYRGYLKRSKEIRALRARLRKEAEEKYRSLRQEVESESAAARKKTYDEFSQEASTMHTNLLRLMEEERKRFEAVRAKREAFLRSEYTARSRIVDESISTMQYFHELYNQEILLFLESEMDFMEEREASCRDKITDTECRERNLLWQSFSKMQIQSELDKVVHESLQARPSFEVFEAVNREEIAVRFRIERKEQQLRSHFQKQYRGEHKESKELERRHTQFDKWRDRQIFHLEQLRREELYRIQLEEAARKSAAAASATAPSAAGLSWESQLFDERRGHHSHPHGHGGTIPPPATAGSPGEAYYSSSMDTVDRSVPKVQPPPLPQFQVGASPSAAVRSEQFVRSPQPSSPPPGTHHESPHVRRTVFGSTGAGGASPGVTRPGMGSGHRSYQDHIRAAAEAQRAGQPAAPTTVSGNSGGLQQTSSSLNRSPQPAVVPSPAGVSSCVSPARGNSVESVTQNADGSSVRRRTWGL